MVEAAFAIPICLLIVFGILEYSRYFMLRNILANSVQKAARYAVIHTSDKTTADIEAIVRDSLGGQQGSWQRFTIKVYATDSNGNEITGASWNNAAFGAGIGVQAEGDYRPILPNFLMMPPWSTCRPFRS